MGSKITEKEGIVPNFDGLISIMLGLLKKSDLNFRHPYRFQHTISQFLTKTAMEGVICPDE